MRHDTKHPFTIAAEKAAAHARASELYAAARAAVVERAVELTPSPVTVEALRAAGGWSAIIRAAGDEVLQAMTADLDGPRPLPLAPDALPWNVIDEVEMDLRTGALRGEVQDRTVRGAR